METIDSLSPASRRGNCSRLARSAGSASAGAHASIHAEACCWIAITHARLRPMAIPAFAWWSVRVLRSLPNQPGLLGHDARLHVLKREACTWTAWRDLESMRRFLVSGVHAQAQAHSSAMVLSLRTRVIRSDRGWLPANMADALDVLDSVPEDCVCMQFPKCAERSTQ